MREIVKNQIVLKQEAEATKKNFAVEIVFRVVCSWPAFGRMITERACLARRVATDLYFCVLLQDERLQEDCSSMCDVYWSSRNEKAKRWIHRVRERKSWKEMPHLVARAKRKMGKASLG